jgi:protein gp37
MHPPPPNLWLGVSVEQRRHLDRLAALYATPAAIRFASFEPLLEDLGTIDMTSLDWAIAGAESDAWRRVRPMQLDWVRNIRDQCQIDIEILSWLLYSAAGFARDSCDVSHNRGDQQRPQPGCF